MYSLEWHVYHIQKIHLRLKPAQPLKVEVQLSCQDFLHSHVSVLALHQHVDNSVYNYTGTQYPWQLKMYKYAFSLRPSQAAIGPMHAHVSLT